MRALLHSATVLLRQRWRDAHTDDTGATAIEWAIFAILALTIAALVAAAITLAVTNRLGSIV
jgi:Flp pilus assembly pilin Flp